MFLLWLRQLPWCGDQTSASVPPSTEGRSSCMNTPVFPLGIFILPSVAWFYVFFSTGQILLSAPSWCSTCTSVSEGVYLMYPWREMYSTSSYSFAIFFQSPHCSFDLHFSNSEWCWASFHVLVSHLYVFFGEMFLQVSSPLFDWVVCFSGIELYELLIYLGNELFFSYLLCYYFLPFWGLSWHFEVSFAMQKLLSFIRYHLFIYFLNFHYSRRWIIEDLALIYVIECSAYILL